MADKRVSDLPRIGAVAGGSLFAVEQNGTAYSATGAQIAALGGGSGGSEGGTTAAGTALVLDFTDTVTVQSKPDDLIPQGFDVVVDANAVNAADRVLIKYLDRFFPGDVLTAEFTSRQYDEADNRTILWASPMNMYQGAPAAMRLTIDADGAHLTFWPFTQSQADMEETDETSPAHIKNNPVKIAEDGYTEITGQRRLEKASFNTTAKTITVTLEGGVTETMSYTEDSEGNMTSVTLSDGHTITIEEVS